MKKTILAQFVVLLIGTVFAWFNFAQEYLSWVASKDCTTCCSANIANPFSTPCFYGAIFFTIAFVLSIILVKKSKST
ncbi:MAG: hypothetical protein WC410_02580 [Candidatus Paceibacterota bacterium]|jgi:hypothetical protein